MTDNEIVKALEWNISKFGSEVCFGYMDKEGCKKVYAQEIINLITRQQAEIERLKERCTEIQRCDKELIETLHKIHEKQVQTAKSEAVKEFAERLEQFLVLNRKGEMSVISFENIDYLVKEMESE